MKNNYIHQFKGLTLCVIGLFMILFLVGIVSAAEWDNKLKYENGLNGNPDLKVDFKNSFLGIIPTSDIGSIELKSHEFVDRIKPVKIGNSTIMWYEFSDWSFYKNGLGEVIITDMDTGEIINRSYEFVYWGNETYQVPNYIYNTFLDKNGTIVNARSQSGTKDKTREAWLPYTSRDIPKEKITIGIKIDILMEETLDFVWTIVGKKVKKHAVVTSGAVETTDGAYTIFTYANNGTFNLTGDTINAEILICGGGGSGGKQGAGGSGAQCIHIEVFPLSEQNFNISVGPGGIAIDDRDFTGGNGTESTFDNLTALKGVGGSAWGVTTGGESGYNGGGSAPGNSPNEPGQGTNFNGGNDDGTGGQEASGGGGGGTEEGGNATADNGGKGGDGEYFDIVNGTNLSYGSGAGGGLFASDGNPGDGGLEDGGQGSDQAGGDQDCTAGQDGRGSGGGGGSTGFIGCDGGDGIVIIRVLTSDIIEFPTINLDSPANTTNFTLTNDIIFNATIFDNTNITNVTLYVNDLINETNITAGLNNSLWTFNVVGFAEGNHTWTMEACNFNDDCINATPRTFSVDVNNPALLILAPPTTINFHAININLSVNWSINDTNLDVCILEYEGVNRTLTCSDNQTEINITTILNSTIIIYANDTFGNVNSSSRSWTYKVFENNQTFNANTTEGSLETFLADIQLGTGLSVSSVSIVYNNSVTVGQSFAQGNSTILRKIDLLIPNVEADENVTFFWNLTLSDSTEINLTSHNQTIFNLDLDDCSVFTNQLINFTVVDEEFQTPLPLATIEIAVNIFSEDRSILVLNDSSINTNTDTLSVCLNLNISAGSIYSLDTLTRYEEIDSANEFYNIVNFSLTNETETQNITLFDLNLTDSTEFQLTFTGSDFLPVENALVNVDRQYISENVFKTVELPKTDFNGQTILHLVRNDVIYNLRISKDGVVLGNFENIVAFCEDFSIGDCKIELNAFDSVIQIFDQNTALGITYTPPFFNDTLNTISFNFLTTDGSAREVRLEVTRNDIFGNNSICNSTLISSGGTLTCSIDPALEDTILNTDIFVDDVLTVVDIVQLDSTNFGVGGYLIMFIISMSFILMFSGSKTGVLISLVLTLATSIGLGLVSSNLIGVGASGMWLLVMILLGILKLNSKRES